MNITVKECVRSSVDDVTYTDKELLDFLQDLTDNSKYSGQVVCRDSGTGRGWRLHEVGAEFGMGTPNVREAITNYMEELKGNKHA